MVDPTQRHNVMFCVRSDRLRQQWARSETEAYLVKLNVKISSPTGRNISLYISIIKRY